MPRTLVLLVIILIALVVKADDIHPATAVGGPSQFVLDMVHHNPGEARTQTMFLDPQLLKSWGFNGDIPKEYVQAAVTFDAFDKDIFPQGSKERAWVEDNARHIDALIKNFKAQRLPCYPFTDFIVLPKRLVQKYKTDICDAKGRIDISRPKTQEILRVLIDEIFKRFPDLGGLTVRHGETYLQDLPYYTGGNPILNGPDSHVQLINLLRDEICVKRNKVLVYRTWDLPGDGFHNNPAYYLSVTDRIEPHPNLFFSIKHQWGDFHRLSRFNPCLGIGKHRQIVEVCCQLDSYGKEAYPYYNGQGVIDGWEEYANQPGPKGLRDIVNDWRYAGTWTWSRGGGWKGPYIPNEFWCEMNTYVIATWAQDPKRTEQDVFDEFARKIAGIDDAQNLARLREIALLSAAGTLRSQNSLVHKLDVWWNRDQYFGDITGQLKHVIKDHQTDAFFNEKADATRMWKRIETLSRQIQVPDPKLADFIRVSCTYGRIKCEIIEQMCRIILFGLQAQQSHQADPRVAESLAHYDQLWTDWRKLRADNPDACATLYVDRAFNDKPGMGAAIDKFRSVK